MPIPMPKREYIVRAKRQPVARKVEPVVRLQFETFRKLGSYEMGSLTQAEPYCWNGTAAVRKYRVTVELVDEPVEVLRERVQALWDKCDNHHNWGPLQAVANSLGMGRLEKSNHTVERMTHTEDIR